MIYPDVTTEIEPPGLRGDDDDGDDPHIAVACWVGEVDDTHRAGYTALPPDATDAQLADGMLRCMLGAAAMRSPGLVTALQARIATYSLFGR